jgi:hypothetical protein
MGRNLISFAAALAASVLLTPGAVAQDVVPPGWGFGATVGVVSVRPEADEREFGPSVEGTVRYALESSLQFVGGASFSSVNVDIVDDKRQVLEVFIEPRYVILKSAEQITPYFGLRAEYLHVTLDTEIEGESADITADGWGILGTFGMIWRLSPTIALDAMATYGVGGTGDPRIDGEPIPGRDGGSAWTGGLKVGLVFSAPR